MSKLVKNVTAGDLVITDINGVTIVADDTLDLDLFDRYLVFNSVSLISLIVAGSLVFNDGTRNLNPNDAINAIKGVQQSFMLDANGRQYVVTSARPLDMILCYTSKGDALASPGVGTIGTGEQLLFDVPPSSSMTKDVSFCEEVMFLGGKCCSFDAEYTSYGDTNMVVPAGLPYPARFGNGNFDYVGGSWVPNITNTGKYFISATETTIHKFVNCLPLYNTAQDMLIAQEPSKIPSGYLLRFHFYNASTTKNLKVSVLLNLFRKNTI